MPKRSIVHLLDQASSWGLHSAARAIPPLPEDLAREHGVPPDAELRGAWPVREEVIPLGGIRVTCRIPGVRKATLQPGAVDLPLTPVPGGAAATVPSLGMHAMVVFEE